MDCQPHPDQHPRRRRLAATLPDGLAMAERDLIWLVLDGLRSKRGSPTLAELTHDLAQRASEEARELARFSLDYFADASCLQPALALLLGQDAPRAAREG